MVAPCNKEQRRQATRQACNRVRSALTHWVNTFEGKNLSAHHLSKHERSDQLRFLGLTHTGIFAMSTRQTATMRSANIVSPNISQPFHPRTSMTWITTIPYEQAEGRLRQLYDRVKGPDNNVDNIMLAHSLRPHTMEGHMALYKQVLHHTANKVAKVFVEVLGVYTSALNRCLYCVDHHATGLARLLNDDARSAPLIAALRAGEIPEGLEARQREALRYARTLCLTPAELTEADAAALRASGWNDGEILEINQVVAYFAYANRTVLGLGVTTDGDVLGLSPHGNDWQHR
jgi:uncharacterized peroxidase-related enzyme